MKNLTLAAVALAAGLTSFAPIAFSDPGSDMPTLSDTINARFKEDEKGVQAIDRTTTGSITQAKTAKSSKKASSYDAIIARHAQKHGIPVALARAVVRVESNFRPNVRGSAGEIGLMQIKPATARMLGYSGSAKGLYDPETNIRFGMKYLAMAHKLGGGDTCGTILRYNAGHAAKRMNKISAAYCAKVKRHMGNA